MDDLRWLLETIRTDAGARRAVILAAIVVAAMFAWLILLECVP